jgi:hypothetical protein
MEPTTQHPSLRQSFGYIALLLSGFAFWFILGYPFQHHNESYIWAVHLDSLSFGQSVLHKMVPVANHRPLGQAVIWLTYRLSDGSVAPAQVFNFVVAICAWIFAFWTIRERRVFAVAGLIVGSMLFSGYIYIFHLHGAFYSAVLVGMILFVRVFEDGEGKRLTLVTALAALVAALFHPYALLLFLGAAGGAFLKHWRDYSRIQMVHICAAIAMAVLMVFVLVLLPGNNEIATFPARVSGLLMSYTATEVHPIIVVMIALLGLLTAANAGLDRRGTTILTAVVALLVAALFVSGLPVILAWVAAAIVKCIIRKRYSTTALIAVASILPAFAPTGSPTYVIFVVMMCAYVLAQDAGLVENFLQRIPHATGMAVLFAAIVVAVMLRSGVNVPVVARLAAPVLSERERTEQLVDILTWWRQSPYAGQLISLGQAALNPVEMKDPADRKYRPPTANRYLIPYIKHRWTDVQMPQPGSGRIVIVFGEEAGNNSRVLFTVPGVFAEPARVLQIPD